MKLDKKKQLAKKVLGVGKSRVIFDSTRLDEIKEAITRQDILDLVRDKAIKIKPVRGRKSKEKRRRRRGPGKIKMKVKDRKGKYVKRIRMIRKYLAILLKNKKITKEQYQKIRLMAKMGRVNDKKAIDEAIIKK
mgnify:CR=1 FL=1